MRVRVSVGNGLAVILPICSVRIVLEESEKTKWETNAQVLDIFNAVVTNMPNRIPINSPSPSKPWRIFTVSLNSNSPSKPFPSVAD